jgi:oligoribonuclease
LLGIFLDTETNGLNWSTHVILEIAFIIKNLNTGETIDTYETMIIPTKDEWERSNPESLSYTGISLNHLENKGISKSQACKEIIALFKKHSLERGKAVFICQNPSFDRIFFSGLIDVETQERLHFPYYWLDLASMFWSKHISKNAECNIFSISKDAIGNYYGIEPEQKPHRALQGVEHLITCYRSVVGFPGKEPQAHV